MPGEMPQAQRKGQAMPVAVKPEEVPTFSREVVSQYVEIFNYQTALLGDAKRATKEAVAYTAEDGVTPENWGQIASGLRAVGKTLGVKLAIVFKPGDPDGKREVERDGVKVKVDAFPDAKLYVKHNGDYVALTEQQIAERKAKRIANAIEKRTAELVAAGVTPANAKNQATAEVNKQPVK